MQIYNFRKAYILIKNNLKAFNFCGYCPKFVKNSIKIKTLKCEFS